MSYRLTGSRRLLATLLAGALALAALALGMTGAPNASAHTLTIDRAERAANTIGRVKVNTLRNDYVAWRVISCSRLFAHQVLCKIGYDTPATVQARRYACVDWRTAYYRAHSEGLSNQVFHAPYGNRHEC